MSALAACEARLDATELVWEWAQEARVEAELLAALAEAETDPVKREQLEKEHAVERARADALAESALVRIVTAWEVFLRDLLEEYLSERPEAFEKVWGLRGATEKMMALLEQDRPFQSTEKAKDLLKRHISSELFKDLPGWAAVRDALTARHAIVHAGGSATRKFKKEVHGTLQPREWLHSPPAKGGLPATQFERVLAEVRGAITGVSTRAWKAPAP